MELDMTRAYCYSWMIRWAPMGGHTVAALPVSNHTDWIKIDGSTSFTSRTGLSLAFTCPRGLSSATCLSRARADCMFHCILHVFSNEKKIRVSFCWIDVHFLVPSLVSMLSTRTKYMLNPNELIIINSLQKQYLFNLVETSIIKPAWTRGLVF